MTFEALLQAIVRGELRVRLFENRLRYRLHESLRPGAVQADRGEALVYALAEHHDALIEWLLADAVVNRSGSSLKTSPENTARASLETSQITRSSDHHRAANVVPDLSVAGDLGSGRSVSGKSTAWPVKHGVATERKPIKKMDAPPGAGLKRGLQWQAFLRDLTFEESIRHAYREAWRINPVHHVAWVSAPESLAPDALRWAVTAWANAHPSVSAHFVERAAGGYQWIREPSSPSHWNWFRWRPARTVSTRSAECSALLAQAWSEQRGLRDSQTSRYAVTLCLVPLAASGSDAAMPSVVSSTLGDFSLSPSFECLGPVLDLPLESSQAGASWPALVPSASEKPAVARYALVLFCDDLMFCWASSQALAHSLTSFLTAGTTRQASLNASWSVCQQWESQVWVSQKGLTPGEAIQVSEQWLDALWQGVLEKEDHTQDGMGEANESPTQSLSDLQGIHPPDATSITMSLPKDLFTALMSWAEVEPRWLDVLGFTAMVRATVVTGISDGDIFWAPIHYPIHHPTHALIRAIAAGAEEKGGVSQPQLIGRFVGCLPLCITATATRDLLGLLTACAVGVEQIYQIGAHSQSALLSMGPQSLPFSLRGLRGPIFERVDACGRYDGTSRPLINQPLNYQNVCVAPCYFRLNVDAGTIQVSLPPNHSSSGQGEALARSLLNQWLEVLRDLVAELALHRDLQSLLFPGASAVKRLSRRTQLYVLPETPSVTSAASLGQTLVNPSRDLQVQAQQQYCEECYVLPLLDPKDLALPDSKVDVLLWRQAITEITQRQPILRSVLFPDSLLDSATNDASVDLSGQRIWGILPDRAPDFSVVELSQQRDAVGARTPTNSVSHLLDKLLQEPGCPKQMVRHRLIKTEDRFYSVLLIRPGILDRYSVFRLLKIIRQYYARLVAQAKAPTGEYPLPMALRSVSDQSFLALLRDQRGLGQHIGQTKRITGHSTAHVNTSLLLSPEQTCQLKALCVQAKLTFEALLRALWFWCLRELTPVAANLEIDVAQQKLGALGQPYCLGPWHAQQRYGVSPTVLVAENLAQVLAGITVITAQCPTAKGVSEGLPNGQSKDQPRVRQKVGYDHVSRFHFTFLSPLAQPALAGFEMTTAGLPLSGMQCRFASHYDTDLQIIECLGQVGFWLSQRHGLPVSDLLARFERVIQGALTSQPITSWQVLLPWEQAFYQLQADRARVHIPNKEQANLPQVDESQPTTGDLPQRLLDRILVQARAAPDVLALEWIDHTLAGLSYRDVVLKSIGVSDILSDLGWRSRPVLVLCDTPQDWIIAALALLDCEARIVLAPDVKAYLSAFSDYFILVAQTQQSVYLIEQFGLADSCIQVLSDLMSQVTPPEPLAPHKTPSCQTEALAGLQRRALLAGGDFLALSILPGALGGCDVGTQHYSASQWLLAADAMIEVLTLSSGPAATRSRLAQKRIATLTGVSSANFQVAWLAVLMSGATLVFEGRENITRGCEYWRPCQTLKGWLRAGVHMGLCSPEHADSLAAADAELEIPLPHFEKLMIWADAVTLTRHIQKRQTVDDAPVPNKSVMDWSAPDCSLSSLPALLLVGAPNVLGPVLIQPASAWQGLPVCAGSGMGSVFFGAENFWLSDVSLRIENARGALVPSGLPGTLIGHTRRAATQGHAVLSPAVALDSHGSFHFQPLPAAEALTFDAERAQPRCLWILRLEQWLNLADLQGRYSSIVAKHAAFSEARMLPLQGTVGVQRRWVGLLSSVDGALSVAACDETVSGFESDVFTRLPAILWPELWVVCADADFAKVLSVLSMRAVSRALCSPSSEMSDVYDDSCAAWAKVIDQLSVSPKLVAFELVAEASEQDDSAMTLLGRRAMASFAPAQSLMNRHSLGAAKNGHREAGGLKQPVWRALPAVDIIAQQHIGANAQGFVCEGGPFGELLAMGLGELVGLLAFYARWYDRDVLRCRLIVDVTGGRILQCVFRLSLADAPNFQKLADRVVALLASSDTMLTETEGISATVLPDVDDTALPNDAESLVDLTVILTDQHVQSDQLQTAISARLDCLLKEGTQAFLLHVASRGVAFRATPAKYQSEQIDAHKIESSCVVQIWSPPWTDTFEFLCFCRAWRRFVAGWRRDLDQPFVLPLLYDNDDIRQVLRSARIDGLQYSPILSAYRTSLSTRDFPVAGGAGYSSAHYAGHRVADEHEKSIARVERTLTHGQTRYVLALPERCELDQVNQVLLQLYQAVPMLGYSLLPSILPGVHSGLLGRLPQGALSVLKHCTVSAARFTAARSNGPMIRGAADGQRVPLHAELWQHQEDLARQQLVLFFNPVFMSSAISSALVGWIAASLGVQGQVTARFDFGRYLPVLTQLSSAHFSAGDMAGENGWGADQAALQRMWQKSLKTVGVASHRAISKVEPASLRLSGQPPERASQTLSRQVLSQQAFSQYGWIMPPELVLGLRRLVQRINAALARTGHGPRFTPVRMSDLIALAHFGCISVFFEWSKQLFIEVDLPEAQGVIGIRCSSFCLPSNWSITGARWPIHWRVGLLKRLIQDAREHPLTPVEMHKLASEQGLRFRWRDELIEDVTGILPCWSGVGNDQALSVQCVEKVGKSPQMRVFVEAPGWAGPADCWVERLSVTLEAMSQAETLDGALPSPLLASELQVLRRGLSGARRIAKWPPLLTLLEQQISRSPLAPALCLPDEGLTLSYEQLSCLANWLAHSCLAQMSQQTVTGQTVTGLVPEDTVIGSTRAPVMSVLVGWCVSAGQAVVTLLAALKLQVPFLILTENELPAVLPDCASTVQALWVTDQPDALRACWAKRKDKAPENRQVCASRLNVLHWPRAQWRDGSRDDTPRSVSGAGLGDPLLTWYVPSKYSGQRDVERLTREAFMNQLMATTRDLTLSEEDIGWVRPDFQSAQMLQLLISMWFYGGRVVLSDIKLTANNSHEGQILRLLSQQAITVLHLPYTIFCDVLRVAENEDSRVQAHGLTAATGEVLPDIKLAVLQADWPPCLSEDDVGEHHQAAQTNKPITLEREHALYAWCGGRWRVSQAGLRVLCQVERMGLGLTLTRRFFDDIHKRLTQPRWPRWLDNLHAQILLPDSRQAPPGVPGALQISWPSQRIPSYASTGERCYINKHAEIVFLDLPSHLIRHRGQVHCKQAWIGALVKSISQWTDAPPDSASTEKGLRLSVHFLGLSRGSEGLHEGLTLSVRASKETADWLLANNAQLPQAWPLTQLLYPNPNVDRQEAYEVVLGRFLQCILRPLPWFMWPDNVLMVYK
jgi:hypothetical protein